MHKNPNLTSIKSRNDLQEKLEKDSDFSCFMGICFGAGSVLQIKRTNTVLFRMRGDRNDDAFYHDTVFPLAKQYLANGVKIIDEKRKRLRDRNEYTVPVIHSALRLPIKVLFKYAELPLGDKPCSVFPKLFLESDLSVKRESLKGLIAALGSIKIEKSRNYERLEFRNKTNSFLNGLKECMRDAYGTNLSVTSMRAALSSSDTERMYELGAFIHPHHLRYF